MIVDIYRWVCPYCGYIGASTSKEKGEAAEKTHLKTCGRLHNEVDEIIRSKINE